MPIGAVCSFPFKKTFCYDETGLSRNPWNSIIKFETIRRTLIPEKSFSAARISHFELLPNADHFQRFVQKAGLICIDLVDD